MNSYIDFQERVTSVVDEEVQRRA